jgi:hypothetical protein
VVTPAFWGIATLWDRVVMSGVMTDTILSKKEYDICLMAVKKCHFLRKFTKAGVQMNPLTTKNFGFVDMTDDEFYNLCMKLYNNADIAWLQEQRGGSNG